MTGSSDGWLARYIRKVEAHVTSKEKVKVLTELCDDCFETLRGGTPGKMDVQPSPDHGGEVEPQRWTRDGDAFCGKCEPLIRSLMEFDA
jgi:hypothetical protein